MERASLTKNRLTWKVSPENIKSYAKVCGIKSFKYDPFGRRIEKVSPTTTSIFAYDGDNLIEETNSSGTAVPRYSQGLNTDEPLSMLRSSTTSFYDADGLGSITSLGNAAGALAQTYTFDSFGNQTTSSGSLTNPFQYTARESDPETGLYCYRARYYDPNSGRFISEDALARNSDDLNLYRYVRNSPASIADPQGCGGKTYDCGAGCGFRLERDPHKGLHVNWWCNGVSGCLLIPSLATCEGGSSYVPPAKILRCIREKLRIPETPVPVPVPECSWKEWWQKYRQPILIGGAVVGAAAAIALAPATGGGSLLVFAAP